MPGPYADAVAHEWLATGSPYGPLWLWICRIVVDLAGPHPWTGMFLLRALTLAGMVATGAALVRLARIVGVRPEPALWLALAGPFPLLMLLGGVHNEGVMLALLVGGVTVAAGTRDERRALLVGAVLVGAAAAIKVIALVALPFLPLLWWRYAGPGRPAGANPPARRWLLSAAVTTVAGVGVLLVVGLVSGYGLGWIPQVGDGTVGVRWLSVTQQIGDILHLLAPDRVADVPADRYSLLHPIGLGFLAITLGVLTLTALRRPPLRTLAVALLLIVLSSPAPRLWYLLWPLMFLSVDRLRPVVVVAVSALSATFVLWFPASVRPQPPEWVLLVWLLGLSALVVALARPGQVSWLPPPPRRTGDPPP
ncbi:MAG: polyprenol phosphomannose-dependent alpha 1,6 mannosyltransferase MptB [Nocardioides sp.]